MAQILVQLLAAVVAAGFAFGVTLVLVKAIDVFCGGFCLDGRAESEGLDRVAHGEVGFDLGPALELGPGGAPQEPRPGAVPLDGDGPWSVVVRGWVGGRLTQAWP